MNLHSICIWPSFGKDFSTNHELRTPSLRNQFMLEKDIWLVDL